MKDDISSLTKLGSNKTEYKYNKPNTEILETFNNKYPGKDYIVQFTTPEVTSLCPKTGQPDFAKFDIQYIPNKKCIETKSLKLYFFAFRNYGAFMETITNKVLDDLVLVCSPKWMKVIGKFNSRGGISLNVITEFTKKAE